MIVCFNNPDFEHSYKLNFPIYPVGPNNEWDQDRLKYGPKDFQFIVYWYASDWEAYGPYGDGVAAGYRSNGTIEFWDISHGSCTCLWYDKWYGNNVSVEEFLTFDKNCHILKNRIRLKEDLDYRCWKKIVKRMKQLLKQRNVI